MGDIVRVTMPSWGLSMASGKIVAWLAAEGDEVGEGDDLVEIDTDKIAGVLEAAHPGVLRRVVAHVGEDVPVGVCIALIADGEVPDADLDEQVRVARQELEAGAIIEGTCPETGEVIVDGRTIAYTTYGSRGPDVVLVHGFAGERSSWLFVQQSLSADHVVHAIDLPGHGDSAKEVGDGSLEVLARSVLGYLTERGIRRAHLVGHSLGGAVIAEAALRETGRVASLTLLAPAGVGPSINAGHLRGLVSAASHRELAPHLARLFADPAMATPQLADEVMRFKSIDGVEESLRALTGTLLDGDRPRFDLVDQLAGLRIPVTVVWGRLDKVLPAANVDVLPSTMRALLVDDAGHMLHLEQPSAVVASITSVTGL